MSGIDKVKESLAALGLPEDIAVPLTRMMLDSFYDGGWDALNEARAQILDLAPHVFTQNLSVLATLGVLDRLLARLNGSQRAC